MSHFLLIRWWTASALVLGFLVPLCPAALRFETQRIQQSADPADKAATALFRFRNVGPEAVTITSVHSACGCTTAALTKRVYASGETGEIKVVFTFEGRVGKQEKNVQVETDGNATNPVELTFLVEIKEPLTCSSRLLLWRLGEEPSEKDVIIIPGESRKITALALKPASPSEIAARIEVLGSTGKYRLFVKPTTSTKVINLAVACVATFADGSTHAFTVYALVR